jgi:MoaA/NifB/PqqE/SkfB family radical SAM enzyme
MKYRASSLLFGLRYVFSYWYSNENHPLICGIVLHNKCNLQCLHCRIIQRPADILSFDETKRLIDKFYNEGGRTIYFEGGEPFLWHENHYKLEDVVKYAKQKGFLATIIYTNGTLPINSSADTVFVSLDGLKETHDKIRGKTFDRIIQNISSSEHRSLFINYTINNYNKNEIIEFCEFIDNIENIKGMFFYFHSPYYGYDDLFIDEKGRKAIISLLLKNRKKYKILNSAAGLNSALRNDWKRPLNFCRIYEGKEIFTCCRFEGNADLCRNCGYLSYAEIDQVLKLKPSAILNAIKYF